MIRLIATDMDGTLLDRDGRVPEGAFEMIEALTENGICVTACSGRQYGNLRRLFAPVADKMAFVCENGACCVVRGQMEKIVPMKEEDVQEAIRDFEALGLNVLLSGVETCYVLDRDRAFSDEIVYRLRNTTTIVHSFEQVAEPIIKVAGKLPGGIAPVAPVLLQKWQGRITATVSGAEWFDLNLANKGSGLQTLMSVLGIGKEETAAFGDNYNDEPMLDLVGHPYIMEWADQGLHKPSYRTCPSVLDVWKQILNEAK